jgi:uncharacterized membrane protein YoaK (UPF0700 family)
MRAFLAGIRHTVVPGRDGDHGPLPPLLLVLTMVTGLVDAFSYLRLGHVFVANMTGNVVFLAFALVGSKGFSIGSSLTALASFGAGAAAGGLVVSRTATDRARLLGTCTLVQTAFLAASVALDAAGGNPLATGTHYALIVGLAAAMGIQNAAARKLAVPDLTTTVLTLTITGIAADTATSGRNATAAGRRTTAVAAMFLGALAGAALIVHGHAVLTVALALAATAAVTGATRLLGAPGPAWSRAAP